MRILFLADAVFEDLPGGAQMVARELSSALVNRGHSVTFLVGRQNADAAPDEIVDGVRIVRYLGAGRGLSFVRQGKEATRRLWKERPFDIIHTHFAYAALGPLTEVPKPVPRVRTFHGPWDEEAMFEDTKKATTSLSRINASVKHRIRWTIERNNLVSSDAIVALSNCFSDKLNERYQVPQEKITVIPGGADLDRFRPSSNKAEHRVELGLPVNRKIMLSIRRLTPRMGLDNLVYAMPQIINQQPSILLLIGGKGPEQANLEHLIKKLHLNDHVKIVGFIPDSSIVSYYQSADLFVLPTAALEGFGLVTTEALACGLPVIGTPIGAIPEILNGLSPRLVAAGFEPDHLASAIISFFANDGETDFSPATLRKYVSNNYTWPNHTAGVEAIYSRLLGKT